MLTTFHIANLKQGIDPMIISNKIRVWNAEFSREADKLFEETVDKILGMKIAGIKRKTIIKHLNVSEELPPIKYPEYRYIWIEASGRLAEKIQEYTNNDT